MTRGDVRLGKHGYEIAKETDLPGGTIYPLLARLEKSGLVVSEREELSEEGRRRRTFYRLTADGWAQAADARVALAHMQQLGVSPS